MDRVVGVDGSDAAVAAVRWAERYALAAGAQLVLVHAYDTPDVPLGADGGFLEHDSDLLADAARTHLDRLAGSLRADAAVVVVQDRLPARALLSEAAEAALLVVGFRSRSGLARLVMGSVSQQCVNYATCPVTVVPVDAVRAEAAAPLRRGLRAAGAAL
jgi:nucleotide-binding universal stress UspA family protein